MDLWVEREKAVEALFESYLFERYVPYLRKGSWIVEGDEARLEFYAYGLDGEQAEGTFFVEFCEGAWEIFKSFAEVNGEVLAPFPQTEKILP